MNNNKHFIAIGAYSIALVVLIALVFMFSDATVIGTINGSSRYAWSENVGWIDFGTSEGNVRVTEAELLGYAWGENIGWISLNCINDDSCGTIDYRVLNDGSGNLSGYAWGENIGWIQFNPTGGGVSIDGGVFTGYAWGENVGWVVFGCSTTNTCLDVQYFVTTDWDESSGSSGGYSTFLPDIQKLPEEPEDGFWLLINDGMPITTSSLVQLRFNAGDDITDMSIANSPDRTGVNLLPYVSSTSWNLCTSISTCTLGEHKLYVRFYTQWGQFSSVVSSSILLVTSTDQMDDLIFKQEIIDDIIEEITEEDVPSDSIVLHEGMLISPRGATTVYLIEDNTKRPFLSGAVFVSHGYDFANVVDVDSVNKYPTGAVIDYPQDFEFKNGTLIKGVLSPDIFVIEDGKKRLISTSLSFESAGYLWSAVELVSEKTLVELDDK